MSPAPGESHFRLATPMSYTTLASSATIIQFEAPPPANQPMARPTFVQASEAWLDRWHEDCRLTQSDKNLCTRVCRYFNRAHFERTGELLAWPGWATLMAKTGLCKSSVFRGLRKLEQLGALKILHGGHDAKTGWKLPNQYRATPLSPGVILQPGQVANCDQTRLQDETRLAEVGLVEKERIKSVGNSKAGNKTPSFGFPFIRSSQAQACRRQVRVHRNPEKDATQRPESDMTRPSSFAVDYYPKTIEQENEVRFPPRNRLPLPPAGQDFESMTAIHGRPVGPFERDRRHPYSASKSSATEEGL
jgi:hypothetical protein